MSQGWPRASRRLLWSATGCTAAVIALDRVSVTLAGSLGTRALLGEDLTNRRGDEVDFVLAAVAAILVGWTLWTSRARSSGAGWVTSGALAMLTATLLGGGVFFNPLVFSRTPGSGGDELTYGQAIGPLWYIVPRAALLVLAAGCVLLGAWRAAGSATRVARLASPAGAGTVASLAAGLLLLLLNVIVAIAAGTGLAYGVLPAVGLCGVTAVGAGLVKALRGGSPRYGRVALAAGALAPCWLAAAVWLVACNPLVVEPSPVDDASRAGLEPWTAPLLLLGIGLVLAAQIVALTGVARSTMPAAPADR